MSNFDPNAFLDETTTEANSTSRTPVPEGEYLAVAGEVKMLTWQKKDGSSSGLKLEIPWDIQDDNVKALLDRSTVIARQTVMLDLDDNGRPDYGKGKNIRLGQLRSALGLNEPGKPFAFRMLTGRMGKVLIKHRPGDNGDVYDEVGAVTAVS